MSLDHILLGLLREPRSGYDLRRAFSGGIRHFWSAELSQIYPTLGRLERRRWLASALEPSRRGPKRRVYRLTPAGRRELHRWLRAEPQVGAERFAYLAQLFFMDELDDRAATGAFLRTLRVRLADWMEELLAIERRAAGAAGLHAGNGPLPPREAAALAARLPDREFHRYTTLRMGFHSIAGKIAWCEEAIAWVDARRRSRGPRPKKEK